MSMFDVIFMSTTTEDNPLTLPGHYRDSTAQRSEFCHMQSAFVDFPQIREKHVSATHMSRGEARGQVLTTG